jgi:hypothetical protein
MNITNIETVDRIKYMARFIYEIFFIYLVYLIFILIIINHSNNTNIQKEMGKNLAATTNFTYKLCELNDFIKHFEYVYKS